MTETFFIFTLLVIPLAISKINSYRPGTLLGLLISMVFLCEKTPLLLIVPLGVSLILWLKKPRSDVHIPKSGNHPFLPMLLVFLGSMAMVLSFGNAIDYTATIKSESLINIGHLIGPIYFGAKTDDKGILFPSILLSLFAELSILAIVNGGQITFFSLIGRSLFAFSQGGFFTLFPRIIMLLFGAGAFNKAYIFCGIWTTCFILLSKYLTYQFYSSFSKFSDLMISLVILGCSASIFIFLAWQRRYFLVIDNHSKV